MACPFGAPAYDQAAGIMTKCDLCATRIDSGLLPACVATCPTEALAFKKPGEEKPFRSSSVPGFSDPASCGPSISFLLPRGRIRSLRLEKLQEVLEK
jgi:anaerobic dimethyl sulfoxide reductase subunit B (iron-sulfur subunit)